jgi:uncharacterized membrane protein YozB (DUF420 family)
MLASISFVFGILLGTIILATTRRREPEVGGLAQRPTALGWWTLVLGLIAVMACVPGLWLTASTNDLSMVLLNISIAFAFATAVVGIGNLKRHDRHWPTWVGLVAGLLPAIFWIAFALGNILGIGE